MSNGMSDAIRRAAGRMSDEPDEPDTSAGCVDYDGWRRERPKAFVGPDATSPEGIPPGRCGSYRKSRKCTPVIHNQEAHDHL